MTKLKITICDLYGRSTIICRWTVCTKWKYWEHSLLAQDKTHSLINYYWQYILLILYRYFISSLLLGYLSGDNYKIVSLKSHLTRFQNSNINRLSKWQIFNLKKLNNENMNIGWYSSGFFRTGFDSLVKKEKKKKKGTFTNYELSKILTSTCFL